jgi:hypothetical protein
MPYDEPSTEFCLIQGEFIVFISCKGANNTLVVDADALINPVDQFNTQTRLYERKFKTYYELSKLETSFDQVQAINSNRGSLAFVPNA